MPLTGSPKPSLPATRSSGRNAAEYDSPPEDRCRYNPLR